MKVKQVILAILVIVVLLPTLAVVSTSFEVYASSIQDMARVNEQNNCGETKTGIVPLIVEKIECGPDNKLSVTIKQDGVKDDYAYFGSWKAVAEVYFDDKKMGVFDLADPTTIEGGGIDYLYGSSTYLLPWEITTPVTVEVVIHASNISRGEGIEIPRYAMLEPFPMVVSPDITVGPPPTTADIAQPTVTTVEPVIEMPEEVTPTANASAKGSVYLPLLLGLIGLSIVAWVGYQRYGSRLKRR